MSKEDWLQCCLPILAPVIPILPYEVLILKRLSK